MPYRDTRVECENCGKEFIFTVEEQRQLDAQGKPLVAPTRCPDCRQEEETSPGPHEGVVKWYDAEKGYGFISQSSGNDIFFHRTGIAPAETSILDGGVRVTYLIENTEKGPQAVDVARMEE